MGLFNKAPHRPGGAPFATLVPPGEEARCLLFPHQRGASCLSPELSPGRRTGSPTEDWGTRPMAAEARRWARSVKARATPLPSRPGDTAFINGARGFCSCVLQRALCAHQEETARGSRAQKTAALGSPGQAPPPAPPLPLWSEWG